MSDSYANRFMIRQCQKEIKEHDARIKFLSLSHIVICASIIMIVVVQVFTLIGTP
jgi:hypothetical protein